MLNDIESGCIHALDGKLPDQLLIYKFTWVLQVTYHVIECGVKLFDLYVILSACALDFLIANRFCLTCQTRVNLSALCRHHCRHFRRKVMITAT